ncbi:uncharacterized protein LOC132315840 [Cornus florida]|uniref:uncharacterized protein LOC132315840 n=1 Tax=Cornus florida TaxID=4283 RepID=UPI00289C9308|nr:uncharacterized protein LOC132315840 [Cornus florida]
MAAIARAFLSPRLTDPSLKPLQPQPPPILRPLLLAIATKRHPSFAVSCLVSGVDGGGVSDDFVSATKSGSFDREFSVIADMLKKIEPLDISVISKGVSDSAKDSMKQTISTMLGLLPSDQFSVTVRVSKRLLDRLLVSSIITGYTLWNAEYRISLMRKFNKSPESSESSTFSLDNDVWEINHEDSEVVGVDVEDLERVNFQSIGDLSPEVLNYIQQLESELFTAKKELHFQKQKHIRMEHIRESNNDLLEYLRSLESDMVTELSQLSSLEVEEIIRELVRNILKRFFKNDTPSGFIGDSAIRSTENYQSCCDEFHDAISTSRDYLAKLVFWCMLLGHHLRGLENRLHLSCVVGLL